jgi:hypothetical protein
MWGVLEEAKMKANTMPRRGNMRRPKRHAMTVGVRFATIGYDFLENE